MVSVVIGRLRRRLRRGRQISPAVAVSTFRFVPATCILSKLVASSPAAEPKKSVTLQTKNNVNTVKILYFLFIFKVYLNLLLQLFNFLVWFEWLVSAELSCPTSPSYVVETSACFNYSIKLPPPPLPYFHR